MNLLTTSNWLLWWVKFQLRVKWNIPHETFGGVLNSFREIFSECSMHCNELISASIWFLILFVVKHFLILSGTESYACTSTILSNSKWIDVCDDDSDQVKWCNSMVFEIVRDTVRLSLVVINTLRLLRIPPIKYKFSSFYTSVSPTVNENLI